MYYRYINLASQGEMLRKISLSKNKSLRIFKRLRFCFIADSSIDLTVQKTL